MSDLDHHYADTPINVRLRLSALWIATLFLYAYVDIFNLMRADVLEGLLDGEIVNTPFSVNQGFLIFTVVYIVPASLMVYLCLTLRPKTNRRANIVVAAIYVISVALSCIGEEWIYYWIGSAVEIVLFALIVRTAWHWPVVDKTGGLIQPE